MWTDSHCHLDYPGIAERVDEVLVAARAAGVSTFLTIGTRLDQAERVIAIAERFEDVWCTVGVHPHEAEAMAGDLSVERLVDLARHPKVVGLGETGLDFFYEHSPRQVQADCFRIHLEAARRTGLPVVVHTRDADEETALILEEAMAAGPVRGLLHCFSSGADLAQRALDLGFLISFSGILTFRNAQAVRDVAAMVPQDRLLVETDAPYLAPIPHRGRTNEPAYVVHTAGKLAELRGMEPAVLAAVTSANFRRLFDKVA